MYISVSGAHELQPGVQSPPSPPPEGGQPSLRSRQPADGSLLAAQNGVAVGVAKDEEISSPTFSTADSIS